jgi:hypothetical protein
MKIFLFLDPVAWKCYGNTTTTTGIDKTTERKTCEIFAFYAFALHESWCL